MPNRLATEKSLYLRQHAENPVDWWPWCDEAWEQARLQNKPVLVSVGYSSCHWCHVMARESFSNAYIASLMNRHFICIKVDREERPDVDQLLMESVQMITGQGGWPLNAFCLPDGRPFFGGTYFPPEDRGHGIIPWPQLIMRVADYYKKDAADLEENARSIVGNLLHANAPLGQAEDGAPLPALNNRDLITAAEGLCTQYDVQNGGFGGAPKFPPAMSLDFLLAIRASAAAEARPGLCANLDTVISGTLTAMARGGIYDQIGGGFTRYSVDAHWEIPHFEKMLYDNALLLGAYLRGYLRYRDPLYLAVIEETIGWLEREMKAKTAPAFYTALDAESGGKEGSYYVWSPAEVSEVLGAADAARFCQAYGISEQGNFEKTGLSNPVWHGKQHALRDELAPLRAKLLAARNRRPRPGCDSKILTGWNALLSASLAQAGFWLGRRDWLQRAHELVDWLWQTQSFTRADGTVGLYAVYYEDGGSRIPAFLDDYASLAQACFSLAATADWLQPGSHAIYIERANALLLTIDRHFADKDAPGWFFTEDAKAGAAASAGDNNQSTASTTPARTPTDNATSAATSNATPAAATTAQGPALIRKKYWLDNATPSGASQLAHALGASQSLSTEQAADAAQALARLRPAYSGLAGRAPGAVANALCAFTEQAVGYAVLKTASTNVADIEALRATLAEGEWRRLFVLGGCADTGAEGWQLCIGSQCLPPTHDLATLAEYI